MKGDDYKLPAMINIYGLEHYSDAVANKYRVYLPSVTAVDVDVNVSDSSIIISEGL